MKAYIIGIAGEKNSGKDTVASMINYIFAKGVTQSRYSDWITQRVKYDETYKDRITHFADPMKDCLSIMYNIPREYFEDRKYKDDLWYCISQKRFIAEAEASSGFYIKIGIDHLDDHPLSYFLNTIPRTGKILLIKIRTLMQYFGTDIGRKQLGNDLWINATIGKAASIAESRRLCLIPDVRFTNENKAITSNFLYGGDILIRRESDDKTDHDSETIDFTCKYTIDNNRGKMGLFHKVVAIVQQIINKD